MIAGARLVNFFAAFVFDMDGVVTDTAAVHAAAWKRVFDSTLETIDPVGWLPFDANLEYRRWVDGRSREDGIRAFLTSRNIRIAEGSIADSPSAVTVHGLAKRKQSIFDEIIAADGVRAFPDAVRLLERLKRDAVPTALVTSSRNCDAVLRAAGVLGLFTVRVDGNDSLRLQLAGKPDPATFVEATRQLGVEPASVVLLEDSAAGVRAGYAGGFGLVVGVSRTGAGEPLRTAGADVVLVDLDGFNDYDGPNGPSVADGDDSGGGDVARDPWVLVFDSFIAEDEQYREAICTLANGYWGTRGAATETSEDGVHAPGTYFAGVFDRVRSRQGAHTAEVEHMVNAPNWLPLLWRATNGEWISPADDTLLCARTVLELRHGILTRTSRHRDAAGRTTRVVERRFLSMAAPNVAVSQTLITTEDWSGTIVVQSVLDGRVANDQTAPDGNVGTTLLEPLDGRAVSRDTVLLETRTRHTAIRIALAQRTSVISGGHELHPIRRFLSDRGDRIGHEFEVTVTEGRPVRIDKTVVVATSRDRGIATPGEAVLRRMRVTPAPDVLETAHRRTWASLWEDFAVALPQDRTEQALALNVNTFHVLQSVAAEELDLDVGVPARGLHGEGYLGHVFWDELFVHPMIRLRRPAQSRAALGYRYHRLQEARSAAKRAGANGAMFPWQSGLDGRDVTPRRLFNPRTGAWMADNSSRQRHVGLAVAYSVWQQYEASGDVDFLIRQGAELVIEVARYFASLATYDVGADRYNIDGVMGPDEFHDGTPGHPGVGVRNNAYTNILTAWVLRRAEQAVSLLTGRECGTLWDRLDIRPGERTTWKHIGKRLRVCFHDDGVISQFDGYESLPELDWKGYHESYGDLGRLDLILNAEGRSTNDVRASKQADVLMLLYLFSAEELRTLLEEMGYGLPPEAVLRTVDFYTARSTHGSTLSDLVESWVEARRDRAASWSSLQRALGSDLRDGRGGGRRTADGVHLGAMAGTVDMVIRCYSGLEIRDDVLWFHPVLPPELGEVAFTLNYRAQTLHVTMSQLQLCVRIEAGAAQQIVLNVNGRRVRMTSGQMATFALT